MDPFPRHRKGLEFQLGLACPSGWKTSDHWEHQQGMDPCWEEWECWERMDLCWDHWEYQERMDPCREHWDHQEGKNPCQEHLGFPGSPGGNGSILEVLGTLRGNESLLGKPWISGITRRERIHAGIPRNTGKEWISAGNTSDHLECWKGMDPCWDHWDPQEGMDPCQEHFGNPFHRETIPNS